LATTEVIKWELSSDCYCEEYDHETGESKLDEQGNPVPSNECFGCYEDDKLNITYEIIKPWAERNGFEMNTPLKVNGSRMTWLSRSGYAYATPETLIDKLTLNGDFILRFTLTDNTLQVVRASHDELGALFEFEKLDEEDEEMPDYYGC
jgi:hypothetical protein